MAHDWIIEVLSDLRRFSHQNGLVALAAQLEQSVDTARAELTAHGALSAELRHPPDPEDDDDAGRVAMPRPAAWAA